MAQNCSFVLQGLGLTVAQVQMNIASELLSTFVSKDHSLLTLHL
jgi:uncharacterized protein Usg